MRGHEDKAERGELKALITDFLSNLEGKGTNSVDVQSFVNFIACSNLDICIKTGDADRRIAAFDLDNRYANKKDGTVPAEASVYFDNLHAHLTEESARHFLTYLYNRDISKFNPRNIPLTSARQRLLDASIKPEDSWINQFSWSTSGLNVGRIVKEGETQTYDEKHSLTSGKLHEDYINYVGRGMSKGSFGMWMKARCSDETFPAIINPNKKGPGAVALYLPRFPERLQEDTEETPANL
jgi:hypothetical protein